MDGRTSPLDSDREFFFFFSSLGPAPGLPAPIRPQAYARRPEGDERARGRLSGGGSTFCMLYYVRAVA